MKYFDVLNTPIVYGRIIRDLLKVNDDKKKSLKTVKCNIVNNNNCQINIIDNN